MQDIKSTHRNPLHSYTLNNEKIEREIKETIPFTIAMERIKYLGIYLPKETKDLYIENHKNSLSSTKEARIHSGLKTIPLTSGAGKTGQLLVKQWN